VIFIDVRLFRFPSFPFLVKPVDKEQGRLKALLPVLTEEIQAGLDYAKDRKMVTDNERHP